MTNDTPLPVDMSTFWVSNENKCKLQNLIRNHIAASNTHYREICIVLSASMVDDELIPCSQLNPDAIVSELNVEVDEADLRLLPHAKYAVNRECSRVIVLANDTDIIVAFICHCHFLKNLGLQELWIRGGMGKITRYIPIHTLDTNLGYLCKKLPAMHCLTGNDANSKFGTKLSGLKQLDYFDLEKFGEDPRINSIEDMLQESEKYLVKVLRPRSANKTMDDLRYEIYHHNKSVSFVDLPPTSLETRGHCLRAVYNTYEYLYAMVSERMPVLDPTKYGYEMSDDLLIPSRCSTNFPKELVLPCTCKVCGTTRCLCRSNGIKCCEYCACQGDNRSCRNIINDDS